MRISSGDAFLANLSKTSDDRRLAHIKRYALPHVVGADFFDAMDLLMILMIRYKVYKA